MHKRNQETAKRNEYRASQQVDRCMEACNADCACLRLHKREANDHVDQIKDHQEGAVADQVIEKVDQRCSLTIIVGLQRRQDRCQTCA